MCASRARFCCISLNAKGVPFIYRVEAAGQVIDIFGIIQVFDELDFYLLQIDIVRMRRDSRNVRQCVSSMADFVVESKENFTQLMAHSPLKRASTPQPALLPPWIYPGGRSAMRFARGRRELDAHGPQGGCITRPASFKTTLPNFRFTQKNAEHAICCLTCP